MYLADFTTMDIVVAIIYGLLSLIIGVALGYSINSKYKKQVVNFEQENVKLNSSVSSLEAKLEETKKARSNADDEIVLLRNRVRDRDVRIRETEGKMAIISKRYEESQASLNAQIKSSKVNMPSEKLMRGPEISKTVSSTSAKTKATPVAAAVASKVSEASVATTKAPVAKTASSTKVSSPSKKKTKKDKKAGRPAGSKNKKTTTKSAAPVATKKEVKTTAKSEVKATSKKKAGRPAGSTNKKKATTAPATKPVAKRGRPKKETTATKSTSTTAKRKPGRPAGSKNTATKAKTTKTAKSTITPTKDATAKATAPKRRGRPAGSTNKSTSAKAKPTVKTVTKTKKTAPTPVTTRKRGRPAAASVTKTASKKGPVKRGRKSDDLTLIEGVGPKMQEALRNAGYRTFNKISTTTPKKLKDALLKANSRFGIAATESWPTQAKMAAKGALKELQAFQDTLNRGR